MNATKLTRNENTLRSLQTKTDYDISCVLGIDLGGTTIKFGLFRNDELIAKDQITTADIESPAQAFQSAKTFVSQTLALNSRPFDDLSCVGLAMPGILNGHDASLKETANLSRWRDIDFRPELEQVFGKPAVVLNDANAAALAESVFGEYPTDSIVVLTLGTGVGGGIVAEGQPLVGKHYCGGEIGHLPIDFRTDARRCPCGRIGHLEAYVGAAGVVQTAHELIHKSGSDSLLQRLTSVTPRDVTVAAQQSDAVALEIISQTAMYLGRAVAIVAQVVDPSVILLGGGMTFGGSNTSTGMQFLQGIREEVSRLTLAEVSKNLKIQFATLGIDAGIFGAAHFAKQHAVLNNSLFDRENHDA